MYIYICIYIYIYIHIYMKSVFQKADILSRKGAVLYQLCHFSSKRFEELTRVFSRGKIFHQDCFETFYSF